MPKIIGDTANTLLNPILQCLEDENHKDTYHELGDDPQYVYHPIGTLVDVVPLVPDSLSPRTANLLDIPTVWPLYQKSADRNVYTIEANFKTALVRVQWPLVQLQPNTRYLMKITWRPDVKVTVDGKPDSLRVRCRLDVYGHDYASDWHILQAHHIGTMQETLFLVHNWQAVLANIHAEFWLVNGGIDERVRVERVELIEVPNTFGTTYAEIGDPYAVPDPDPPTPEPEPEPEPETPPIPLWVWLAGLLLVLLISGVFVFEVVLPRLYIYILYSQGVNPMEQAFTELVNWVLQTTNVDGLPFAIALGTMLTGLTKLALQHAPENWRPSGQLTALVWQVVIWAFWMAAKQGSFEEQFVLFGTNFTPIVIMLVNSLLGTKFQSAIYDRWLAAKVAVAGYQRSAPL